MELDQLTDEQLIERARAANGPSGESCLQVLYRRYHERVAAWCVRISGDRREAADLAQEVFLRVHEKLDGFRMESRFSTWLYRVARNVCINQGMARRRRRMASLEEENMPEPRHPGPDAETEVARDEILARFRRAMQTDLDPLEAKVLYLHHVHGLTLAGITRLLGLENKSGAKAVVVSGRRKLQRKFGRWLAHQTAGADGSIP